MRQHCFGNQSKSARSDFAARTEDEKVAFRHFKQSLRWKGNHEKRAILEKAIALERRKAFLEAEKSLLPRSNLHDEEIAARVVVFK